MPNLDVERQSTKKKATINFNVPPIPEIPMSVQRRIPEMRQWNQEMDVWRQRLQSAVKDALDNLKSED